ncbi:hypothetical protein GJ496_002947 [Pomphorhynchus laevis]|nr:hypothetical protein GJ496_002947 [Pomphorhynchus laevis]
MHRIVIVSNRLSITVSRTADGFSFTQSIGGVATGLSCLQDYEKLWIGWPGIAVPDEEDQRKLSLQLEKEKMVPVFLTDEDYENFYSGFSNKTLWPLFHYFTQFTNYADDYWNSYESVNKKFAEVVHANIDESRDLIWINDYQLMLLPTMIREKLASVAIGFFLHIPFPSYEIFRTLPWRKDLLIGTLGADSIGFHTFGYFRHFSSAVQSICKVDCVGSNQIYWGNRQISVDVYPMSVDYDKYAHAEIKPLSEDWGFHNLKQLGVKIILSVDRLDYTKGIPQRIRAYNKFLEKYKQYREKVTLVMIVVPCRGGVEEYRELKDEIETLTGKVNGNFNTFQWSPIVYVSRSFTFDELCPMLREADICLVTPLRDGMNLVAKEYIAAKHGCEAGVLILSEMAGAADELTDGIIVNPNNLNDIVEGIKLALEMPLDEQKKRMIKLQTIVRNYTVQTWASRFIYNLRLASKRNRNCITDLGCPECIGYKQLKEDYKQAKIRLLLLDYDGTLVSFHNDPLAVDPDRELMALLHLLCSDSKNTVVLISGRDREILQTWLGDHIPALDIAAEHGLWLKRKSEWTKLLPDSNNYDYQADLVNAAEDAANERNSSDSIIDSGLISEDSISKTWKAHVISIFEQMKERCPESTIEHKPSSIAWHYRAVSDHDIAETVVKQFRYQLKYLCDQLNLNLLEGNCVLEVRLLGVDKGKAALQWLLENKWNFVMAIGDDATDEDTFKALRATSESHLKDNCKVYSVKVGEGATDARYSLPSVSNVRTLLRALIII